MQIKARSNSGVYVISAEEMDRIRRESKVDRNEIKKYSKLFKTKERKRCRKF